MHCEQCGETLAKGQKRFCSRACYNEWAGYHGIRGNMRNTCKQCGKEYKMNSRKENRLFCGVDCYLQYRAEHPEEFSTKKRVTVACEYCGKEFEKGFSAYKKTPHHYCSRECANRARSETLKSVPELAHSKGAAITCETCGQTFYVKYHLVGKRKHCSRACAAAALFGTKRERAPRDTTGKNNPNYKGTNNRTTAKQVYFRSGMPRRCLICSWDTFVDVHHITPRRHGGTNDLTNLIGLCPNHHRMADKGMISKDELTSIVLAAIAELPDHLRPSGLQRSSQLENAEQESLSVLPELPNPSD